MIRNSHYIVALEEQQEMYVALALFSLICCDFFFILLYFIPI